jgi:hypothetical protein
VAVASVAAIISYQHAYELISTHGETGLTAHLLPLTVDGLIWAALMVVLDASRQHHPWPKWSLAIGIVATIGANLAHGLEPRPDRRLGKRLARLGPSRQLRAFDAADQESRASRLDRFRRRHPEPLRTAEGPH